MDEEGLKWHEYFYPAFHIIQRHDRDVHRFNVCPIHRDQVLSHYCEDCDDCLCRICHLNDHKLVDFNQKMDKLKEKILLDLDNKHLAIKMIENQMQKKLNLLGENYQTVIENIKRIFESIRSQLEQHVNQREQLLLDICNTEHEKLRKELEDSIQRDVQPKMAEFEELKSKTRSASPIEIVTKNSKLNKNIKTINSMELIQISDTSNNNIIFTETAFNFETINTFGKVLNEKSQRNSMQIMQVSFFIF